MWAFVLDTDTVILIAAIALEADATVVTRNLRDFLRIPGILAEDRSS